MARKVFFSFHYEEDINRSMVVRNNGTTKDFVGFIDKAEFESVKKQGNQAIYNWIDNQLKGTSVTVVLIGEETLNRPFVQYEIQKSIEKGNAIIGVFIHNIKDMNTRMKSENIGWMGRVSILMRFVISSMIMIWKMDTSIWEIGLKWLRKIKGNK